MFERVLTWAQTAALNPNTPLCISCGRELSGMPGSASLSRCHGCRRPAAPVVPLPVSSFAPRVRRTHLRRAA